MTGTSKARDRHEPETQGETGNPRAPGRDLGEVRDEMLATDSAFRNAWDAQAVRRQLVKTLLSLRREAGLTQRELARRAGWNPAFVSRLESIPPRSDKVSIPSVQTLLTYAAACNRDCGLVFGHSSGEHAVRVDEAVTLGGDRVFSRVLGALDDKVLTDKHNRIRVAN